MQKKPKNLTTLREELVKEATKNPWRLFTAEEIHIIIHRAQRFVLAAKNEGAPFPGGVTRPEWLLDWLRTNWAFTVKASSRKPKKNGNGKRT